MENGSNYIDIGGRICSDFTFSHEIYGEGFYRFDAEVARLSGSADILPVTVSERIIDHATMTINSHVRIIGQIRSYNNYVEADRKNKLVLTVFARDIEAVPSFVESCPNEVFLNGYLCKPPIYRTTPFGREIADMLLAVNRSYNKSDYIPCIAWGRNARFAGRLEVGENVRIYGRMQSRIYHKKKDDGEVLEKTAYEVSVAKVEVGEGQRVEE
ncbi:MAG: single-stranded DNA-binding protein [Defluviitaleaceae bacterium]|nr:single-stranded DNA-binding protein [Defluviitaleaceae bacterium]MCL2273707.1 single-stranded DNA-binding protein [Defluviitaleaceae bacterium]